MIKRQKFLHKTVLQSKVEKMILLQRFKIHETAKNQLPFLSKLGKFAFQERNGFAK